MDDKERLLLFFKEREKFRIFSIINRFADNLVIDKKDYASISCIDGIFYKDGIMTVYSTDERGEIYYEKDYTNPVDAFSELARRNGFEYNNIKNQEKTNKVR